MSNQLIHDLNNELAILASEALLLAHDDEQSNEYLNILKVSKELKEQIKQGDLNNSENQVDKMKKSIESLFANNSSEKEAFEFANEAIRNMKAIISESC